MTYFDWLVYTIAPDYNQREDYMELLLALYSTEFFWVVKRDKNRAEDGLDLRDIFERKTRLYCDTDGPCNCLELFIALAIRCENELMYDPDFGDRTDRWFWMFLDNLGLLEYDSEGFNFDEVSEILDKFMSREYGFNLEFCAFPSSISVSEMKKMELAYQMNFFIKENFY